MMYSVLNVSDLSFSFDDSPTAGNKDDDCTNIEIMEKLKTQYSDVSKEYRRYVISEILVDCYKAVSYTHLYAYLIYYNN